jgi:hypothetical protein
MKTYRSKLNRFKNLDRFSTHQIKALFGFHPASLAEILFRVLPELERPAAPRGWRSALIGSVLTSTMMDAHVR